ncbi:hypothetical protein [Paractinoplanes atraurantiacus]|uniref:Secreted protein n=1 Tax=Paractinoplanes atraurantiacus TaxID=1036182 RepID=A0A285IDJ2_9ACTN|nr:hypothetical protein [Actinoplanes atraurantiacus]SNY45993.1 hypothetical protein SAMN05421748_107346 [Actinoplanes atraurantiacus]
MKAATRILTLVGLSLVTGVTIGAGPAQAATAVSSSQGATQTTVRPWHDDDDEDVAGYYDSRRECERAGWRGERRGWWEDSECDYVWRGPHRGDWKLTVDRDDDDHHGGHHRPWRDDNRRN